MKTYRTQNKIHVSEYPFNILYDTFGKAVEYIHGENLKYMLKVLSRRYNSINIFLDKYRNGLNVEDIETKYSYNIEEVKEAIAEARLLIIKYKDSIFNGFNKSTLCIELRNDFREIKIPDDIVIDLNNCKIYDIYDFVDMNTGKFVFLLSQNPSLSSTRCTEIVSTVIPLLHKAGININKLTSGTGKDIKTKTEDSIMKDDVKIQTAQISKVEPVLEIRYTCPYCNFENIIRLHVKFTESKIYIDNFKNHEYFCSRCKKISKLIWSNKLF